MAGGKMFLSTGDPREDARIAVEIQREDALESVGWCPNGCAPLQVVDAHNQTCPVCRFVGWSNVPWETKATANTAAQPVTIEIYENGQLLSKRPIYDPYIRTTLRPRGWRAALQVLRGRFELMVHISPAPVRMAEYQGGDPT